MRKNSRLMFLALSSVLALIAIDHEATADDPSAMRCTSQPMKSGR